MTIKPPSQKETLIQTPVGSIRVRSFNTPDQIRGCSFDSQFSTHAQFKSIYTKRETLVEHAEVEGANVVLALDEEDRIIGFGVLNFPDEDELWYGLGEKMMIEVRAIEVSRRMRAYKVAKTIIDLMMDHPRIEEMIAYLVGYSWTWDLDGSGKTALQYRQMMIHLFEPYGFMEYQTSEPNICLKPENIFMARIGSEVSKKIQDDFKWLRFGVTP